MINNKKVISFDIWDTIIKRKCNPEEIKLSTAKYIVLQYNNALKEYYRDIYNILNKRDEIEADIRKENKQKGLDGECRILDVFKLLKDEIFAGDANVNKNFEKELLDIEIKQEKNMIYINKDILPIFEKYKDLRMCCISDFYMSAKELEELLNYVNVPVKFEKIYSSADYLLNKGSGNLYKEAEKELDIKPEEHIHVGDNPFCDIEVPKNMGIETIKMENIPMYFEPKRGRKINFDFNSIKKDTSIIENRLYNLGIEMSPLLYFFGYSIIEYAIKNKIDKVYYFTREGERFIKTHELIQKNNPFSVKIPEAQLLEVSRMATFSASLNEFSISELLRLWSQYRVQSMNTLFKTLAINIEPYKVYLGKYDISAKEDIIEPWFDLRVQELCKDKEFTDKINLEIKRKREELLEYFNGIGIFNDEKPMLTVDIGWRGTIQDNLAYIFDKKTITGYYITLYDFFNAQPKHTKKIKFIKNREVILNYVSSIITVLEMIFSSDSGSVIEYKDGKAIRKIKKEEAKTIQNYIEHIQNGMLKGSEMINEQMLIHPFEASEFEQYIEDIIKNIKTDPDKDLVDVYYQLVMNDTFGTGKYIEKNKEKLTGLEKLNIFKTRNKLRKELWKEAYIRYNHIEYIKGLMKVKSTIRKVRGSEEGEYGE